jgi:RHS repeat-associated protein
MAKLLRGIDSSDSNDIHVSYTYNGMLQRGWRSENGNLAQVYQYDAGFNVLNEAAVGQPMKTYVPGLAEVIGNDLETSADYRYLTHDHLGSTRGMWDPSKNNLGTWELTPYGAPFTFAGPPNVTQLYTGHDLDKATGQYYAPFRYLDPTIGRWLNQDPFGMVDGTNMYGYALLNPVYHTDPLGLQTEYDSIGATCKRNFKLVKELVDDALLDPDQWPLLRARLRKLYFENEKKWREIGREIDDIFAKLYHPDGRQRIMLKEVRDALEKRQQDLLKPYMELKNTNTKILEQMNKIKRVE